MIDVQAALRLLRSEGGFTMNPATGEILRSGFAVSQTAGSITFAFDTFWRDPELWLRRYLWDTDLRDRMVGGWVNRVHTIGEIEPPTVVLLPTLVAPTERLAAGLSRAHGQAAYFDLAARREIVLV